MEVCDVRLEVCIAEDRQQRRFRALPEQKCRQRESNSHLRWGGLGRVGKGAHEARRGRRRNGQHFVFCVGFSAKERR